jgi:hypothetical protein
MASSPAGKRVPPSPCPSALYSEQPRHRVRYHGKPLSVYSAQISESIEGGRISLRKEEKDGTHTYIFPSNCYRNLGSKAFLSHTPLPCFTSSFGPLCRDHLMAQNLSKLSNLQIKQVNTWKELDSDSTRPAGTVTILESDLKATSLRLGDDCPPSHVILLSANHDASQAQSRPTSKAVGVVPTEVCWRNIFIPPSSSCHTTSKSLLHSHSRTALFLVSGEASSKDVINVLRHLQKLKEIRTSTGEKAYVCLTA